MNKTRPIRIFWQEGVTVKQIIIAVKAMNEVLKLAGVDKKIKIEVGKIFDPIAYRDIDTKSKFFGQYDAIKILDVFSLEQQVDSYDKYYTVFLIKDEIFMNTHEGLKLIGGVARKDEAAIVRVGYDFLLSFSSISSFEMSCIYRLTMHELGHVFGLPSVERKEEIELSPVNKSRHCANDCIMRPNPTSKEFVNENFFCPTCLCELCDYFKKRVKNFGTISP